ncbi:MAG TPA: hypothetical protein VL197_12525 [Nitrospirota bacterium]|nr:hypothetical protein [Nitrospirota bacterium]
MRKQDDDQIKRRFSSIKNRQILAIVLAPALMFLLAAAWKRPDLFGQFSKGTITIAQILVILSFINFSAWNWICPSCKKYLGNDIFTQSCKKCGARLM